MTDLPRYTLDRVFKAPRELVWRTWCEADLLARWYGPNVETIIHELDVSPGGLWLNEMKSANGSMYQRMEYVEVTEPEKLVGLMSTTDADWNIVSNPMMPDWPKTLLTTVTFQENGGQTDMRLVWEPHGGSDAEIACFAAAIVGLDKGWGAGMDLLAELLSELQA